MAAIETVRSGQVDLAPVAAADALGRAASQHGIQVARIDGQQLDLRRGSQAAFRIKGAWLAKPAEVPVVAAVRFDPADSGSFVNLRCVDDLAVGLRLGAVKRMTAGVEEFADLVLQLAINASNERGAGAASIRPERAVEALHCPSGHPNDAQAHYCSTCGSRLR